MANPKCKLGHVNETYAKECAVCGAEIGPNAGPSVALINERTFATSNAMKQIPNPFESARFINLISPFTAQGMDRSLSTRFDVETNAAHPILTAVQSLTNHENLRDPTTGASGALSRVYASWLWEQLAAGVTDFIESEYRGMSNLEIDIYNKYARYAIDYYHKSSKDLSELIQRAVWRINRRIQVSSERKSESAHQSDRAAKPLGDGVDEEAVGARAGRNQLETGPLADAPASL
jgi:hypothetical protein